MNVFDFIYWLITGRKKSPSEKYLRAAEKGNAKAQLKLGLCYFNGRGVKPNPQEAVRWFRLAAKQGNANAEFYMGRAHNTGEGATKDYEVAYAWLECAAQQGHKDAVDWRNIIAQKMTPEEISEGLALSKEVGGFKAQPPRPVKRK